MMTRHWTRPAYRSALDVDYVTTYPHDPARATSAIREACSFAGADDQVVYRVDEWRVEATWTETPFPGTRFRIPAEVGGVPLEVQVDVGYGDPLVPPPVLVDLPTLRPGPPVRVLACRPELGFAWKVHGLFEFPQWRAKDLHDLSLMVRRTPLDRRLLADSLRVAFESRGTPLADALRLFEGAFGTSRGSRACWRAFRRERSDATIPEDHLEVVRLVSAYLRPVFRELGV